MSRVTSFLTRTRGQGQLHWTDWATYVYLIAGTLLMFGPVLWLFLSSFKTEAGLERFPPTLLPYQQLTEQVDGYDDPLPLFRVTSGELEGEVVAQIRRLGIESNVVRPDQPEEVITLRLTEREPIDEVKFTLDNYRNVFERFNFLLHLKNSVFITVVATLITLVVNSMAAFGLSKYQFRGRAFMLAVVVGTLMIPLSVVLVPTFVVVKTLGLANSHWGIIIPSAASTTGVFLLRQYMLTIPDEILEAARMDKASEWKIFWRIIIPLSAPAIAVLAILSIMWRWNDFLWPLIVLSETDQFTLQLALNSFQNENDIEWNNIVAMTILVLIPVALVFSFLQKYIATGIASTGGK